MKNFPHQYNDIHKVRGSLTAIRDEHVAGMNPADDGVLGYDLARRGIYQFRALNTPLEERIVVEQTKPSGSQGARTAAREIRRTLRDLGFITGAPNWALTAIGEELLTTPLESTEERAVWQRGLMELAVSDADGTSHPVRLLLRLTRDQGQLDRRDMELALEARDDGEAEYARIRGLLPLNRNDRLAAMGATEFEAANATKILPAFAEQAGLITRDNLADPYMLTEFGQAVLIEVIEVAPIPIEVPAPAALGVRRRRGRPHDFIQANMPQGEPDDWHTLSAEDQIGAIRRRLERTQRHQVVLQSLAGLLQGQYRLMEDPASFDLLAIPLVGAGPGLLFEVKTLEADAHSLSRAAVGQLLEYEFFIVAPAWPDIVFKRAVVFESGVPEEVAAFLQWSATGCFVCADGQLVALNDYARGMLPLG